MNEKLELNAYTPEMKEMEERLNRMYDIVVLDDQVITPYTHTNLVGSVPEPDLRAFVKEVHKVCAWYRRDIERLRHELIKFKNAPATNEVPERRVVFVDQQLYMLEQNVIMAAVDLYEDESNDKDIARANLKELRNAVKELGVWYEDEEADEARETRLADVQNDAYDDVIGERGIGTNFNTVANVDESES